MFTSVLSSHFLLCLAPHLLPDSDSGTVRAVKTKLITHVQTELVTLASLSPLADYQKIEEKKKKLEA